MKHVRSIGVIGLAIMLGVGATTAAAQSNRTFVSGHGSDSNPCSLAAPCRSFAQALTQTNAGGEITILDPAGYGAVTIGKAVSIVNDGVGEAGVAVTSGDAITITAGATDTVNLRGLTLVGVGVGNNGITLNSAGALNLQNCVIRGFANDGINAGPTSPTTINVADTVVSSNLYGIFVQPAAGVSVSAAFERVQVLDTGQDGFFLTTFGQAGSTLHATIANSLIGGNNGGVEVAGTGAVLNIISSRVVNNNIGLFPDVNGVIYLALSTVSGSKFRGYDIENGAVLKSYGNNFINDTSNLGSLTAAGQQ